MKGRFETPRQGGEESRPTPKREQPEMKTAESRPAPRAEQTAPAPRAQQRSPRDSRPAKKRPVTVGQKILRVLAVIFTFIGVLVITLVLMVKMICGGISPSARQTYVTTMLETGQLKFMATWFMSGAEIQKIVDQNSMEKIEDTVNSDMITIRDFGDDKKEDGEAKDIEVIEIPGRTFAATLIKVRDPSRIKIASIFPWRATGDTLGQLVENNNAIGGINGGIYNSTNNSGGAPYGVVVCNGEIQYNKSNELPGLVLIGFTEENILQIIDINGKSPAETEQIIRDNKIRDAITFQEESSDANNHFVQLIINGNPRGMDGVGSGLNPRTVIGQCADGSVLLLVTDGRGKSGHLGASASDLIDIMTQYGAVNAANLDGGSSSCMYYNGEYLRPSVTFYQANSSWYLPVAFVISK